VKTRVAAPGTARVGIYTRQSVDEHDVEFKSVEAQRDAVEAYVTSQRGEGWTALPERYDDAGYSGKDTNRPAFQRLMRDVEAGRVDLVAVYKIDRLSRSIGDFVALTTLFEKHGVTFVSITQQFSTSTSVGRLTLHLLATFAQFERETISERTRDKMQATRKRGMWAGGPVPLGYDLVNKKLVVNADEAEQVRAIFRLYLDKGSLLATVDELNRRGWRTKSWVGKRGQRVESYVYSIESLRQMLHRVVYIGMVRSGDTTHPGVHEAIIDQELWDAVQAQKRRIRPFNGAKSKNKYGALIRGLLICGLCGSSMHHSVSTNGPRQYSYYSCNRSRRFGRSQCAAGPVPRAQIEAFIIDRVRAIGRDPALVRATIAATKAEREARAVELQAEMRRQDLERRRVKEERTNLINAVAGGGPGTNTLMQRVAELDEHLGRIETRLREVRVADVVDDGGLEAALSEFDGLWDALFPRERERVLKLLIERVSYASTTGALQITFRTSGLKGLGAA
jgi:site-specific DNA recombinase